MKYQKSTLNLPVLAFISTASLILLFVFHFFLLHTLILTLSFLSLDFTYTDERSNLFLGLVLLKATAWSPLALLERLVKLWKWKKTRRECWQLWYMENIKRAESSLVVRGANMIITLYLRSISAVSSLRLLSCAVHMMVILRLRLPFMPFWLICYELQVVNPFICLIGGFSNLYYNNWGTVCP